MRNEKGQILLIIILIMVVVVTVGLSVASRTITNLKIAVDDENSQRAFSAAEAGVERILKSDCSPACAIDIPQQFGNNASYTVSATAVQGNEFLIKAGTEIKQDEGADIWLSTYSTDPSLIYGNPQSGIATIYWAENSGDCNTVGQEPAALEIMLISGSKANPVVSRFAVDPCGNRRAQNSFSSPNAGGIVGEKAFSYSYQVAVTSGILMRVIPLYTNTKIGISGITFPLQGKIIDAVGQSGGTARRVSYVQTYSTVPAELFQYVMISL